MRIFRKVRDSVSWCQNGGSMSLWACSWEWQPVPVPFSSPSAAWHLCKKNESRTFLSKIYQALGDSNTKWHATCTGEQQEKIAGGLACVDLKHSCHVRFSSHSQIVIVKLEIVLHLKCLLGDLSVTLPVSGDNEQDWEKLVKWHA